MSQSVKPVFVDPYAPFSQRQFYMAHEFADTFNADEVITLRYLGTIEHAEALVRELQDMIDDQKAKFSAFQNEMDERPEYTDYFEQVGPVSYDQAMGYVPLGWLGTVAEYIDWRNDVERG